MEFLGTLFIIFFILWLLGKILSRYWPNIAMWLLKRQMRRQMDQAFGAANDHTRRTQREYDPFGHFRDSRARAEEEYARRQRRRSGKIIDPAVGEYVEFEEISAASPAQASGAPKIKPEPQIEDADWEEIS